MKLFLIQIATLIVVIKLQCCTAQLFPWSNLKQYFDQKTKNGPGNGGVLNIRHDLEDAAGQQVLSTAERPYRHTQSDTSVLGNNPINVPDGTATLKDVTKHILKYNKNIRASQDNNKIINFNYGDFYETGLNDKTVSPILSVNHDSTVKPHLYKENQNVNIHFLDHPKNVIINDNDETQPDSTILITQKPFLASSYGDRPQFTNKNNRLTHKTVSILPQPSGTKTPSILQYDQQVHPILYVTSRPITTQVYPQQPHVKSNDVMTTHRPMRPVVVDPFHPTTHYTMDTDSSVFLPTIPPNADAGSRVNRPSKRPQNLHIHYGKENQELLSKDDEQVQVEMVPSLGISLKSSSNKPFKISDTGLVDYLVPPPMRTSQSAYGTKRLREPKPVRNIVKGPTTLESADKRKNKQRDDLKVLKEMSRLKPPENVEDKKAAPTQKRSNKKLQSYLNSIKGRHRLEPQNEGRRHIIKQNQIPIKTIDVGRNKYHNHKMQPIYVPPHIKDGDFGDKENKAFQHDSAPSQITEQIVSETSHGSSNLNDGQRVEFQMHGQNGPKSYKFGFDTGKGHNRQFRYEERDTHGHVKGHYGYYDKEGKLQVVNYEADPHHGFKAEPGV